MANAKCKLVGFDPGDTQQSLDLPVHYSSTPPDSEILGITAGGYVVSRDPEGRLRYDWCWCDACSKSRREEPGK